MKYKKGINSLNPKKWVQLLNESKFSSPFQTLEFYHMINRSDGLRAEVYAIEEKEKIIAICVVTIQKENGIKGYFSRRAIIYGGPVTSSPETIVLTNLMHYIVKDLKGKAIYVEQRNYFDYSGYKNLLESNSWQYIPWLNFQLDIQSRDQVLKNMSSSRRRQIKKSLKSGATWEVAKSINDVKIFYTILVDLYKNKIKKPLPSWSFFYEQYKMSTSYYLLVYYKNEVIGGILCPTFENRVIYEFYICGLDLIYKEQHPSILATWAALDYALQNEIRTFDFMGAGSPTDSYSVREFKSRFGGREVEYGRFLFVLEPLFYYIGKMGLNLLKKLN